MTNSSLKPEDHPLTASNFQQTCGYCGCVFRVDITWRTTYAQRGIQDGKVYDCPECQRECRIRTSTEPRLTLISRRTDGRTDIYPRS